MVRKAIIIGLTLGLLATGTLWGLSCICPWSRYYSQYGGGGRVVGKDVSENRYLVDIRASGNVRVGLGIENGALLIVHMESIEPGSTPIGREIRLARFRLWRQVLKDPILCGQPLLVSMSGGGITTLKLVHGMRIPCWGAVVLFAAYPTIGLLRGPLRRRRRRRGHLCQKCGYNLTGNVSGVCPECGRSLGDIPAYGVRRHSKRE